MNDLLLEVNHLSTIFAKGRHPFRAINRVSFALDDRQVLCLVGESGCGKSVTALSIMRLVYPPGKIVEGKVLFKGRDLLQLPESLLRKIRGNEISMIFQEPMVSLNPVLTIGQQIVETIQLHQGLSKKESIDRAVSILGQVRFPDPVKMLSKYPFELSGGLRQRAMIGMALSCEPSILIADEPTTALDVTIQKQILELMGELREKLKMAVILITHDLGVVAEMAEKVAVMYAGEVAEMSDVETIFNNPLHPYTQALHHCIPRISGPRDDLYYIKGAVPELNQLPPGCPFSPRCDAALPGCSEERPDLREVTPGHHVKCWRA